MDPPPPYSPPTDGHHPANQSVSHRWHPKMTPSRLFVLSTTVVLGSLKAFYTYRGKSNISTTLEWIIGVVFTLFTFILGEWEFKDNYPKVLERFFKFDCTDLLWRALSVFSIPRPLYRSEEISPGVHASSIPFTPITGYRILVSSVVVLLGTLKAALAYLGHDTTANTFDWTLSVLATSSLYYIGLYEYNSIELAPTFFTRDQSSPFVRSVRDITVVFVLGLAMYGCILWADISLSAVKNSYHSLVVTTPSKPGSSILEYSVDMYMLCGTVLSLILSLTGCLALFVGACWALQQEAPQLANHVFRRGTFKVYYDRLVHWAINNAIAVNSTIQRPFHYVRRIGYPVLRIIAHVFAIISIISLALIFLGLVIFLWQHTGKIRDLNFFLAAFIILMQILLGAYVIGLLWFISFVFSSLIAPFCSSARAFWYTYTRFLRMSNSRESTQIQV